MLAILNLKNVVEKISYKYFNNKKPFDENKVSFQDAIIWESIVEYCNKEEPDNIVFISNNHKDFADRDKINIHEDLIEDIPNISYYNSLSSFLDHEEDDLRDYFIDNFDLDESELKQKLIHYLDDNESLSYTVDDFLRNHNFQENSLVAGVLMGILIDTKFQSLKNH